MSIGERGHRSTGKEPLRLVRRYKFNLGEEQTARKQMEVLEGLGLHPAWQEDESAIWIAVPATEVDLSPAFKLEGEWRLDGQED